MAVELSGDTGAAMWSYIHVQSVQSNTTCHNNYDRTIKTFFFFLLVATASLSHKCSPWLALVSCKVIVISHNFITWWHKAISIACVLPTLFPPKGSSRHMCMTTPCRIDKVMPSKSILCRYSAGMAVSLFFFFFYNNNLVITHWIQVSVMVPNRGLLWDEFRDGFPFIIAQAYCICDVTFLIFNKVGAHIRRLAEQLTASSSCSRLMSRLLFTPHLALVSQSTFML